MHLKTPLLKEHMRMEFHHLPKVDQQNPATRRCKKSLFNGHIFNIEYGQ